MFSLLVDFWSLPGTAFAVTASSVKVGSFIAACHGHNVLTIS